VQPFNAVHVLISVKKMFDTQAAKKKLTLNVNANVSGDIIVKVSLKLKKPMSTLLMFDSEKGRSRESSSGAHQSSKQCDQVHTVWRLVIRMVLYSCNMKRCLIVLKCFFRGVSADVGGRKNPD